MENPIKMDDLGVPLFLEAPIFSLFKLDSPDLGKRNVSVTIFPKVDKLGNIDRKHNVSATIFPEGGKLANIDRKHNISATIFPKVDKL